MHAILVLGRPDYLSHDVKVLWRSALRSVGRAMRRIAEAATDVVAARATLSGLPSGKAELVEVVVAVALRACSGFEVLCALSYSKRGHTE